MLDGIHVSGLTKSYSRAKSPALVDVSIEIAEGEIFGLIGPNGAGKTTFLGCLLGLLNPTGGTIRIDGAPPDAMAVRMVSGYLPERLQFDRWMTGRGFLAFQHCLARQPAKSRDADVVRGLTRVGLETDRWDMPVKKYSRGMLQRLGMAQALVGDPKFVFLDEPASGVDPAGVLAFRDILTDLKRRGATVILNSHQLDQLERVCDRVAYIEAGKIRHIENLHHSEQGRRVLVVRWLVGDAGPSGEGLAVLAKQADAEVLEVSPGRARLSVGDDAGAAAVLRALVQAGFPVIEAAPEHGRLEKLFRPDAKDKA
jgi:ABC-2 type transport system ATP-binding protein